MRFSLSLIVVALGVAPLTNTEPHSATDVFTRAEVAWKGSCRSKPGALCARAREVADANACSTKRRVVRVLRRSARAKRAQRDFVLAVELAEATLASEPISSAERLAAQRALAGSRFYLAEAAMETLLRGPRLPALDFDPDRPKRTQRDTKRFRAWLANTKRLASNATDAYAAVVKQQAGGEFQVAAAARLARVPGRFAELLEDAPIPGMIRRAKKYRTEMRKAYCRALGDVAKPLRTRAKAAHAHCLELASRLKLPAKRCE